MEQIAALAPQSLYQYRASSVSVDRGWIRIGHERRFSAGSAGAKRNRKPPLHRPDFDLLCLCMVYVYLSLYIHTLYVHCKYTIYAYPLQPDTSIPGSGPPFRCGGVNVLVHTPRGPHRGGYPLLEFIFFLSDRISLQELDLSFSTVFFFLQTDTVVRRMDARKICLVRKS